LKDFRQRTVVEKIVLGSTIFQMPPEQFVNYDTFWNAPTVAFLRFKGSGIFSGIENPFFRAQCEDRRFELSFEPALIIQPGEIYDTEPQFIGVYHPSGVMLVDHNPLTSQGRRPRFRNPSGYVPIDRSEVRAMQRFTRDYLALNVDGFRFILYNFFYPLPQMPTPDSPEEAIHLKMIDTFAALGGDTIIFNPMYPYTRPEEQLEAYWDLGPEGSSARRIMDHAAGKGIRFGFYMGCARHGTEGNACALPFAPSKKHWKKVDDTGKVAEENCIGCDEYAQWYFAVQRNTIERFKLGLWSWDPGPGNGLFCHNKSHGHLPGKGGYKGWRNATAVLRNLKEAFPDIYLQAYYGRKEHGLWGFKYFDQHESYWELGLWKGTMHPDFHTDRMNADGVRHQGWWNQNFRFHPAVLTHGMVHRFQEGVWDPRLTKAWDHLGWRYSVMSGLACAGSITAVILPEDLHLVPEMKPFYDKWLSWARENFEYVHYNLPFGSQVRPGGVDGWARIKEDHGFVFLCNPGPRPAKIEFSLDEEIGLSATGLFTLTELYPLEGRAHIEDDRGVFAEGEIVSAIVPAYEVLLLELAPSDPRRPQKRTRTCFNERSLPRYLDDWRSPEGAAFLFPRHEAHEDLILTTRFFADPAIRNLLNQAIPSNLNDFEPLIPNWRAQCTLDHFGWTRPDRLWLVLPFVDAELVDLQTISLNSQPADLQCHRVPRKVIYYADITDLVVWSEDNDIRLRFTSLPENQFLGPYLDYPADTERSAGSSTVLYNEPLDPDTPPRFSTGPDDTRQAPTITDMAMDPPFLKQGQETIFSATVDLPPCELEGVYISGPVADSAMTFNGTDERWIFRFTPSRRFALIMDVDHYRVWAVARNGLVSLAKKIILSWRF
jgi:hypothetical protein